MEVQGAVAEATAQAAQNAQADGAEAAASAVEVAAEETIKAHVAVGGGKAAAAASDSDETDDDDDDDGDDDDVSDSEEEGGGTLDSVAMRHWLQLSVARGWRTWYSKTQRRGDKEEIVEPAKEPAPKGLLGAAVAQVARKGNQARTKDTEEGESVQVVGCRNRLQRLKDYVAAKDLGNEEQFKDVEALLQKFEGKEAALFRRLRNKYGPGPGMMDLANSGIPSIQLVENEGCGGLNEYLSLHPDSARRVYDDVLDMSVNGAVGEESGEAIDKEKISRCLIIAASARSLGGLRASDILAGIPLEEKASKTDQDECWTQAVPFRERSAWAKTDSFKKRTEAVRRTHAARHATFSEWEKWEEVLEACYEEKASWQQLIVLRKAEADAWKSVSKHAKMRSDALIEEIESAKASCRQQGPGTAVGKGFPEVGFDKDVALGKVLDSKRKQQKQWKKLKTDADSADDAAIDSEYDAWAQVAASEKMYKDAQEKLEQDKAEKAAHDELVKKNVNLDQDQTSLWNRKFFAEPPEYREEEGSLFDHFPGGSKW